jgi:hypothetical protein
MPITEAICCPFCGWWRTNPYGLDNEGNPRWVRFDRLDPAAAPMWRRQRLIGAGRGSHKSRVETLETRPMADLPEDLKKQMREQCQKILAALEEKPRKTSRR